MKLPRRGMSQRSFEELRWYYQDSPSEVGERAGPTMASLDASPEAQEPSGTQRAAARRQKRVRWALARLPDAQQSALKACYTVTPGVDHGYGIGDGAVLGAYKVSGDLAELQRRLDAAKREDKALWRERLSAARLQLAREVMAVVKAAHRDYLAVRRAMRAAEREIADRAETIEHQRAAMRCPEPPQAGPRAGLRRQQRALALAEAVEAIGAHPLEAVRAAAAELVREL